MPRPWRLTAFARTRQARARAMEAFGLAFGGGSHESGEELFQHAENGPGGEAGGKKKGGKKKKKKPKGGGGGGGAPVMTMDMLGGGYGGGPEEEKFAGGNFTKSPAPEELPMPSEGLLQFLSAESLDSAASSTPGGPLAATAQGNGGNASDALKAMLKVPGTGEENMPAPAPAPPQATVDAQSAGLKQLLKIG